MQFGKNIFEQKNNNLHVLNGMSSLWQLYEAQFLIFLLGEPLFRVLKEPFSTTTLNFRFNNSEILKKRKLLHMIVVLKVITQPQNFGSSLNCSFRKEIICSETLYHFQIRRRVPCLFKVCIYTSRGILRVGRYSFRNLTFSFLPFTCCEIFFIEV